MTYDLATPAVGRLWPHKPDWRGGVRLTRSFLTDIITSRNGTEQRRALRDVPRLAIEYEVALRGDNRRLAEHNLKAAQNLPAVVPDWSRYSALTGASSAAGTTLTLATPPAWVADDRHLVLFATGDVYELALIDTVADPTINLTAGLDNDWAIGAIVRPGLFGLLSQNIRSGWPKPDVALMDMRLDVYPGGEPAEDEGSAGTTLGGLEVFTQSPDWSGPPSMEHIFPVEQIDFGRGRTAQFRPITWARELVEMQFTGLSIAQAVAIEQLFLRMKGKRGAFYRPTCRPDMDLATNSSGTTITVSGSRIADDFAATDFSTVAQAIEIIQTDGTRLHRTVTNVAASSGNSAITLDSSVTVTTATTARISWMPKVRFASDELTTEWLSPQLANISCVFQAVQG